MKQLGVRLCALREGIGLSQSKFSDVIDSTQFSINRYENGQATPTLELLHKYAAYFDILFYISMLSVLPPVKLKIKKFKPNRMQMH